MLRTALGILCFLPAVAAAEWIPAPYGEGESAFFQRESIGPRGKYMKAWLRIDYEKDRPTGDVYKWYRSMKTLLLFDCRERRIATIQQVAYSKTAGQGETVFTVITPESQAQFDDVVPETTGEARLQVICATRAAK